MRALLIVLLSITSITISAQKSVTWVGGTPGKENQWNEPKNWSDHHVPDDFSNVIIPDVSTSSFAFPVITDGTMEVNSIYIESGGKLTVHENAKLVVYDQMEGLANIDLKLENSLQLADVPEEYMRCMLK